MIALGLIVALTLRTSSAETHVRDFMAQQQIEQNLLVTTGMNYSGIIYSALLRGGAKGTRQLKEDRGRTQKAQGWGEGGGRGGDGQRPRRIRSYVPPCECFVSLTRRRLCRIHRVVEDKLVNTSPLSLVSYEVSVNAAYLKGRLHPTGSSPTA